MSAPILIGAEEHWGLIGKTRSGKTTFAKAVLIPSYGRIVIIDSKTPKRKDGKTDFPNIPECTVSEFLSAAGTPVKDNKPYNFRWRLKWDVGEAGKSSINKLCYDLLDKGINTAIYFDEVSDFCSASEIPPGLLELIRKGGGLNINVGWGTQRPALVNRSIWVNTSHFFVFYVNRFDSQKMEEYIPGIEEQLANCPMGSHRSVYIGPDDKFQLLNAVKA